MTTVAARRKTRAYPDIRHMDLDQLYDLAERLHGLPVPGVRMSEEEFEAWCDEELRAEWVDGKVILMSPVSLEHDELDIWLIALVGGYVEEHDLGAIYQNIFVRLAAQRRRRVPDLLFVSNSRLHLRRRTYLDGAPDLIIEIISPDSQSRDRREKFEEYEKAGVREYWIIDPLSQTAEAYRLKGRRFDLVPEKDGVFASTVLRGFWLKISWLWQRPLPKVAGVLKQLASKARSRSS